MGDRDHRENVLVLTPRDPDGTSAPGPKCDRTSVLETTGKVGPVNTSIVNRKV